MRTRLLLLLIALVLWAAATPANAQAPERQEAFVYGLNAAAPDGVIGTFSPPTADMIYILAGETSMISPRHTFIYYWPITNEYRAAWTEKNVQLEGTLQITQRGQPPRMIEQTSYTIQYYSGERTPRPLLYLGEEAEAAHSRFESARAAYQADVRAYEQAGVAWLELARELQREEGEPEITLPPMPEPPAPLQVFSTGLNRGFPVNLPVGTYTIQTLLPDGTAQPGTERRLVVFDARRMATGYRVIPEARWTMPEDVTDPADAILGNEGGVFYLQPHVIREYPALAYEHLLNPQYQGDTQGAEWRWVLGEPVDGGTLEVIRNGQVIEQVLLEQYRVRQIPGSTLGYEILPYDQVEEPGSRRVPDFKGYRIALTGDMPAYGVRLRSPDGAILVGSDRQVRALPPIALRPLLVLPLLPIFLGSVVYYLRRRSVAEVHTVA
jgi:hypothetical protein